MLAQHTHARWIARLAVVSLVLQVAIPRGYMPADLSSGWFLKLCPQGMSVEAMVALFGDHHHHHHHHGAGDGEDATELCELAGLQADAVVSHSLGESKTGFAADHRTPYVPPRFPNQGRAPYESRAPPLV